MIYSHTLKEEVSKEKKMNIINSLIRKFGYCFIKIAVGQTRASTSFAKEYFKNRKINVVEIGVYEGTNANNILKELNVSKIYLIDPYMTGLGEYDNKLIIRAEEIAHNLLRKYNEKIIWFKDNSENTLKKVGKPDFIYVDGNHSYKYVKKDLEFYYKILKEDGILAGDDISLTEVSKAFWEFVIKNKINYKNVYYDKSDWWIIKKGGSNSYQN